jgi:hypothetical protein
LLVSRLGGKVEAEEFRGVHTHLSFLTGDGEVLL